MKHDVVMPVLGPSIESGLLIQWLVPAGGVVKKGMPLFAVETDKSVVECEAPADGVLARVIVAEGATARVDELLAELETEGPSATALVIPATTAQPTGATGQADTTLPPGPDSVAGRHRASPRARRVARDAGVDTDRIQGTGPGGRVVERDVVGRVQAAVRGDVPVAASAVRGPRDVPLSSMRRAIAARVEASARDIPAFHTTMKIRADALVDLRKQLRESDDPPLTLNDLIVRASALTLVRHPRINATWHGDHLREHGSVDIAVAVSVDDGLLTPIVRDADKKSVAKIAAELRALRERAAAGRLVPAEYQDGTFTVSNLGMHGVEQFTAIIQPPQCAILAVGAIDREVVLKKGAVGSARVMRVTLTVDHRAIDGATAAAFLADLRAVIEAPARLLL